MGGSSRHYECFASDYIAGLPSLDTAECRDRFLAALRQCRERAGSLDILDLGCGPGRDLASFAAGGHKAVGIEGAPTLARAAMALSGCAVQVGDFLAADLGQSAYDGIYAHSVLFNVRTVDVLRLLRRLGQALRPGGVLFACDPMGANLEGESEGRIVSLRRPQTWRKLARDAGFHPLSEWRRPPGVPRRRQDWLASLWRWPGSATAVCCNAKRDV